MDKEIKVIIADDHPIFRQGLKMAIESERDLHVIGEADNGETAVGLAREMEPDILVLDVDMPKMDGFQAAEAMMKLNLAVDLIFLTMHNTESLFNAALDLGVKGYVLKDSALPEIVDCIRLVASGGNYISPPLSTYLVQRSNRNGESNPKGDGVNSLTTSEQRILRLIAKEKTSREIADELFISVRTVDRHRANIMAKLDLHGGNALVKFALLHRSEL